ncbi:MAG TPA: ATP-binding cassette domain-containing protein [Acidimicrobiales bacterium]|nr:ATP-binding cassette domain-containing protein [Acidimicrobiales bacterium]
MSTAVVARVAAAAGLVAAGPVLVRVAPELLTPLRAFILASGLCFVAMALSLDVLSGHAGLPSLGHGALLAVGALTSGVATGRWFWPFAGGALLAAVVTAAIALAVALPAVRLAGASFALVTLALGLVLEQSLFRWQWLTAGTSLVVLPRPQIGAFVFDNSGDYIAIAAAVAVFAWVVEGNVAHSSLGRALHLVRDDPQVAQAMGIDPRRARIVAFVVSGALAGVAGSAFGHLLLTVSADTFRYSEISLPLLAVVVVAGGGSRLSVGAAGFFYAVTPRLLTFLRGWEAVLSGISLALAMVHSPGGAAEAVRRRRRRSLEPAEVRAHPFSPPASDSRSRSSDADRKVLVVSGLDVDRGDTAVLRDVSVSVRAGSVVAVVGPNGAGKTTLLDAVSGFVACRAGRIFVGGTDITNAPAHDRRSVGVGRTFQRLGLPAGMAVREALLVSMDTPGAWCGLPVLAGTPAARRCERRSAAAADEALERVGLCGLGEVPMGELSVGQRRLVELAGALGQGREVLLLDEPSAALAPAAVQALAKEIRSVRDAGTAIVLVEHDLPLVRAVADEVMVLAGGRLLACGPASEVLGDPDVVAAWLGARPLP